MRGDLRLQDLLEIENDVGFLELMCPTTGVLAWPAIRNDAFRSVMMDVLYESKILVNLGHSPSLVRIGTGVTRSLLHNATRRPRQSSVLFYSTGAGLIPKNGRLFNRHIDYFADCLPGDSWSIEALFGDTWPRLPRTNDRVSFSAPHRFALAIGSRIACRPIHRNVARRLVDLFARRGREMFGWQLDTAQHNRLVEKCARRIAVYPITREFAARWIERIRPKLAVVEEGCYGHMAVFNATARDLGVTVAEFAHGLVTKGHDVYNVAPLLAASTAYRRTQPNCFLGHGEWGNKQFNAPVERVAVGSPHRAACLEKVEPFPGVRNNVLVIGDGIDTEMTLKFCEELSQLVAPTRRVVFRPHPLERDHHQIANCDQDASYSIDLNPDVYASLRESYAVVAEQSTVLFEAVGIAERIFVWKTAKSQFGLPSHPFAFFTDAKELGA